MVLNQFSVKPQLKIKMAQAVSVKGEPVEEKPEAIQNEESLSDMEIEEEKASHSAMPSVTGRGRSTHGRGGRGSAAGRGRGRGKARAAKPMCVICQVNPRTGNNPYCKEDKKEYDALRKDCIEQGKEDSDDG